MMNKMCMAAVIAASLYAGTTFAQPAAVKKIIETGQTDNTFFENMSNHIHSTEKKLLKRRIL